MSDGKFGSAQQPGIRFLVESALRKVKSNQNDIAPRTRAQWVEALCTALISESDTSHHSVIAALMASGVGEDELMDYYAPTAARLLGEQWVQDRASFVDVTVGAGRLQALYRARGISRAERLIPLGQSFLMVVPEFEQHSLGAFVAAEQLRRHGIWVHMGIGLSHDELAEMMAMRQFAAVGFSLATWNTVEKITEVIDYIRTNVDYIPPIVVGGRAVTDTSKVEDRTGADFAVRTVREAVERCALTTTGTEWDFEKLG